MSELFDVPETLSPRLKWMREHGINTHYSPCEDNEWEPWSAFKGTFEDIADRVCEMEENGEFVTGHSEEEVLWKLSQNLKIPHWKASVPSLNPNNKAAE